MTQIHTGGCLCGAVRFEISGRFEAFFLCHCSRCRKDTGSAHAANLFSATAAIRWTAGAPTTFRLPGTRHAKSFCATCGGALPTEAQGGGPLMVPAGCLDTAPDLRPAAHLFCASRADWDRDLDRVPQLDGGPA